ncbi:ATP-binding protein [uncultured Selenomonas sp.]|uniref:ATP-binding protein n=1 Tax=uncultured Selenomonas sp. TaxID=159275 RepID=UPI00262DCCEC|nr:ATP-binding protein [uncultured Selenomonas sp.]
MLKPRLQELCICRPILEDALIGEFLRFLENPENTSHAYAFTAGLIEKAELLGFSGNILRAYFLHALAQAENTFARTAEQSGGHVGGSLRRAFVRDMEILADVFHEPPSAMLPCDLLDDYAPTNRCTTEAAAFLHERMEKAPSAEDAADAFLNFYRRYGCGEISSCKAFSWNDKEHRLQGVERFEALPLADIIGCDRQKRQLTDNTEAFLEGRPANNVLLIGARGTGKSSSVKALAHEYYGRGLRLVQLAKSQLGELPRILAALRGFPSKRFILFLDDLSFEEFETEYKYLKSAIEGGIEVRPKNVLIYATSNRRHLIKESWRDRDRAQDELYRQDSMNETVSLSDRFGLIITFLAPDQEQYHAIIAHYLEKDGVRLAPEELRILAHRWELEHSGRSGRTAQQFAAHYLGQMKR